MEITSRLQRYNRERKDRPNSVGLLIEGDSWFNLPSFVTGTNLVMAIKEQLDDRVSILDLSRSGDEVREMLAGDQFDELYKTIKTEDTAFDAILFSGGGNDLVGPNILPLLKDGNGKTSADECINHQRLDARIQQIIISFDHLVWMRDDYKPNAHLFTHGYDFASPNGKGIRLIFEVAGGWVRDRLETKRIPEKFHQQIVNALLSKFNAALDSRAKLDQKWTHIPTQGTLDPNDWHDELHPTRDGFNKLATKFVESLRAKFPSLKNP